MHQLSEEETAKEKIAFFQDFYGVIGDTADDEANGFARLLRATREKAGIKIAPLTASSRRSRASRGDDDDVQFIMSRTISDPSPIRQRDETLTRESELSDPLHPSTREEESTSQGERRPAREDRRRKLSDGKPSMLGPRIKLSDGKPSMLGPRVKLSDGKPSMLGPRIKPPVAKPSMLEPRVKPSEGKPSMLGSRIKPSRTQSDKTTDSTPAKKQLQAAKTVEVPKKLFHGFVFFFVPNDNIGVLRKLRTQRAREYGAMRAESWSDDVTHIILENEYDLRDVLRWLKVKAVPEGVHLVKDNFFTDCLKYQWLVPANEQRYQVEGAETLKTLPPPRTPTQASEVPDASKGQLSDGPRTPSRTDDSLTPGASLVTPASIKARQAHAEALEAAQIGKGQADYVEEGIQKESRQLIGKRRRDALEAAIEEMQLARDLPLDLDDEDPTASMIANNSSSDSERDEPPRKKAKKTATNIKPTTASFRCMEKNDGNQSADNPNARTVEVLQQMASYYDRVDDRWRTLAYRKAITALKNQPHKVSTREEAIQIKGIGSRLADKIEEIVWTNKLRRLDSTTADPDDVVRQQFMGIYQVGYRVASQWIAQGYRSLEALKNKPDLTKNQKIGLEHYDDFLQRIPRAEVEQHGKMVRDVLKNADKGMQAIIGGSYRRGASDSGDVDLIITKEGASLEHIRTIVLGTVIPRLFQRGFLQVGLATAKLGDGGSKWHGASALPGSKVWRRIDFLFVPWSELGGALIYFTGNDIFNRSIRLLASQKGMRLNQHGLFRDVMRGPARQRITEGELVEGQDERRIFEILGVPWRRPEHRIC